MSKQTSVLKQSRPDYDRWNQFDMEEDHNSKSRARDRQMGPVAACTVTARNLYSLRWGRGNAFVGCLLAALAVWATWDLCPPGKIGIATRAAMSWLIVAFAQPFAVWVCSTVKRIVSWGALLTQDISRYTAEYLGQTRVARETAARAACVRKHTSTKIVQPLRSATGGLHNHILKPIGQSTRSLGSCLWQNLVVVPVRAIGSLIICLWRYLVVMPFIAIGFVLAFICLLCTQVVRVMADCTAWLWRHLGAPVARPVGRAAALFRKKVLAPLGDLIDRKLLCPACTACGYLYDHLVEPVCVCISGICVILWTHCAAAPYDNFVQEFRFSHNKDEYYSAPANLILCGLFITTILWCWWTGPSLDYMVRTWTTLPKLLASVLLLPLALGFIAWLSKPVDLASDKA